MLLLTRKVGQIIRIGDDQTITIADVRGNCVLLGTNVPGLVPTDYLMVGVQFAIGAAITIMIVQIRGSYVKLGITAPRNVAVHRQEIWERIQADRRHACTCVAKHGLPSADYQSGPHASCK